MSQLSKSISVRGMTPKPWGSDEWSWREYLADKMRASRCKVEQSPDSGKTTEFDVEVVFLMKADNIGRADLDNLAKPVLDTLFRPRNAQVKNPKHTGALFENVDDDRVFTLTLRKQRVLAASDEGVDITVSWKVGAANDKSAF